MGFFWEGIGSKKCREGAFANSQGVIIASMNEGGGATCHMARDKMTRGKLWR